ncbi:A24 family peptidase [Sandarakinorhabdus sp. DWP1-3-1]|uniref:A24 family peptidase n=1 Tax=Sandarakinorhabdus sp. DWP1-3-1 TaxID=2804627 RepID=UPI003CFAF7BD
MLSLPVLLAMAALGCVVAAMLFDLATFEIPDALSIALVGLAIAYGLATPGFDWLSHLGAVLLVFGVGLFVFSRGWMGGGDIKLLTGVAAWTALDGLALQLTATALAGGLLALVLLATRLAVRRMLAEPERLPRLFHSDAPLPYAVAIAAGTIWWAVPAWPIG